MGNIDYKGLGMFSGVPAILMACVLSSFLLQSPQEKATNMITNTITLGTIPAASQASLVAAMSLS